MPSLAIISDIESLRSGFGQLCSVGGAEGLCTYSMLCTFAKVRVLNQNKTLVKDLKFREHILGLAETDLFLEAVVIYQRRRLVSSLLRPWSLSRSVRR